MANRRSPIRTPTTPSSPFRLPHILLVLRRQRPSKPQPPRTRTPSPPGSPKLATSPSAVSTISCKSKPTPAFDLLETCPRRRPLNSRFLRLAPAGYSENWVRQSLGDRVDFRPPRQSPRIFSGYCHRIARYRPLHLSPTHGHTTTSIPSGWASPSSISSATPSSAAPVSANTPISTSPNSPPTPLKNSSASQQRSPPIFLRLSDLRRTLRDRMRSSPLLNGPQFTRDVEAAYRQIWTNYCGAAR